MIKIIQGNLVAQDDKYAIVIARFNDFIGSKLLKYSAVITLGAVIKGSTPHFDYVSAEVSKGVAQVALQSDIPVIFGVLTTDNIEQAIERAGTKAGNKGADAAKTAIEMVNLIKEL